ncbi:MAG TPA: MOSC domain-containing protein [Candidatus Dormibacteraeota bacterium]|nr:MOSC domain-containing protein [Candidatus Dormibacteraeota bacterium]
MKIISLNVGLPRVVVDRGREVATGIFKSPAAGPLMLRETNLDGDRQADLSVHGGANKAVYAYPFEHYEYWRNELSDVELTWGNFGENLTTECLLESEARIGDQFRIGGALVKVTQPRLPCFKLGIRFGRDDMVKRFLSSGRSGIYFSVLEEGLVNAGDAIELLQRDARGITIADVNRAYAHSRENLDLLRRIVAAEVLPRGLHSDFVERLASLEARPAEARSVEA